MLKPVEHTKFKRGKLYNIEWSGGGSNDVRIDLYSDNQRLQSITTAQNTGVYRWNVPSSLKPGKNYQLLLSDSRNSEDQVYSEAFSITHKIPNLVKGAAVIALGAAAYFLIPTKEESIPDPPGVPDN